MNGKGDKARPITSSVDEFANNWEMAFGKKDESKENKTSNDNKEVQNAIQK